MTTEEALLETLVNHRWETMRILADEARDRGEEKLANGWLWLAHYKKWPAYKITWYHWYFRTTHIYSGASLPDFVRFHPHAIDIGDQLGVQAKDLKKLLVNTAKCMGEVYSTKQIQNLLHRKKVK